jgi:hypothetical protein
VLSLMLASFEQAFGTVEWPFIGQACAKWIKYIHTDIPSAVINNAHLSYLFLPVLSRLISVKHTKRSNRI